MDSDFVAEALWLTDCPPGDRPLVALFEIPDPFPLSYVAGARSSAIPAKSLPSARTGAGIQEYFPWGTLCHLDISGSQHSLVRRDDWFSVTI